MAGVEQSLHVTAQHLRDELRGAWRFRWHAMAAAWITMIVGWLVVASLPDSYLASSKVYVDSSSRLGRLLQGLAVETNVEGQVAFVRQTLLSRPHLARLVNAPEFGAQARTPSQLDSTLESLRNQIEIVPVRGIETAGAIMLSINFRDPNRDRALYIVRSLVEGVVQETQGGNRARAEEAQSFLLKELKDLEEQLGTSEDKLAAFKRANFGVLPGQGGDYFSRLQAERLGLDQAKSQLGVIQSQRNALNDQLRGQAPLVPSSRPMDAGVGGQRDLDTRIRESESRLEDLLLRYTEKHPEVLALKETIADLKARRIEEMQALQRGSAGTGSMSVSDNPLYQSIQIQLNKADVDAAALRADVAQRERRIAELQRSINTAPEVEAELSRLNRDYGVVKAQYEALRDRLQKARLSESAEETGVVKFEIIEPPAAKSSPVGPNRVIMMLAVLLGSIGAGAALAYGLHQLRPVFSNAPSLSEVTKLPVLGTISIGRIEEHMTMMRSSMLRFGTAFAGLLLMFGFAFVFRNWSAVLFQHLTK